MPDPQALLRSPSYVRLLVVAAVLGVPVSAVAYGFLALVNYLQKEIFTHLPHGLGFATTPVWWPLPVLAVGGLIAAAAIRYLPGDGGPSPAGGFKMHGPPTPAQLPGVVLAALATLIFGAVLGPEMPLILLGGGLVLVFLRLARRDVPEQGRQVLASAGKLRLHQHPAGIAHCSARSCSWRRPAWAARCWGWSWCPACWPRASGPWSSWAWTPGPGWARFPWPSPACRISAAPTWPNSAGPWPSAPSPRSSAGASAGSARRLHTYAERQPLLMIPLAGLAVAGLAIGYAEATGKSTSDVLFSGQSALGPLIQHSSTYTVGALLVLVLCKSLAYGISLGSFRGGPIFPALFIGAAGGIALSHLPGLPLVPAVAMGLGAMSVVMLTLPLTSVLLATILLFSDGLAVTPLVIVAVVVAYVVAARIAPADDTAPADDAAPEASTRGDAGTSPAADEAARPVGRHRSPDTGDGDLDRTRSDRTQ